MLKTYFVKFERSCFSFVAKPYIAQCLLLFKASVEASIRVFKQLFFLVFYQDSETFTNINISLFYIFSNVFKKVLAPSGFVFLCAFVHTTINNDIADIANNMKFSKFKNQFSLFSKKALICLNPSSILLVAKSIKEDFFVKMWSYKQKLILKKYPISRVYTSKISVACYTMGIITFVTLLFRKFILKKFGQIFRSKFWRISPRQTRYQDLLPLEKSRTKYFSVSLISNAKRYHP